MIPTIEYRGKYYLKFQSEGFAAKFAIPFAQQLCKGRGYDIGCNRIDWCLPGAIAIDPTLNSKNINETFHFDAYKLPEGQVDYIFSSHCLEHLRDWVEALDYWHSKIKKGGVLFLYLPHPSQSYWRPWNNRKHIHSLYPDMIREYLQDRGWVKIHVTEADLNYSFTVVAEKDWI